MFPQLRAESAFPAASFPGQSSAHFPKHPVSCHYMVLALGKAGAGTSMQQGQTQTQPGEGSWNGQGDTVCPGENQD